MAESSLNERIAKLSISGEMPLFKGSDDPTKFFKRLERYGDFLKWSETDLLSAARLSMRDKAEDFIHHRPDVDELASYKEFKEAIVEHFTEAVDTNTLYSALTNAKQGTLTVSEFNVNLEKAAQMLRVHCKELTTVALNNMQLSSFIAGLAPELCQLVTLKGPTTIKEAFKLALQMEKLNNISKPIINKTASFPVVQNPLQGRNSHSPPSAPQRPFSVPPHIKCYNCGGNHYARNCRAPNVVNAGQQNNYASSVCRYCNLVGHDIFSCQLKAHHERQNNHHAFPQNAPPPNMQHFPRPSFNSNTYDSGRYMGQPQGPRQQFAHPHSHAGGRHPQRQQNF